MRRWQGLAGALCVHAARLVHAAGGTEVVVHPRGDAGYPGTTLNLIRKINVVHLTIRGQRSGTNSVNESTKGYQSFDFQTSISARNLSYQNRYF